MLPVSLNRAAYDQKEGRIRFGSINLRMTRAILLISAVVSIGSFSALAGEIDPRFDGKWVGVENFRLTEPNATWKTPHVTTVMGIAQSGKMLGVLSGFLPARYLISPKSGGNILIFYGGHDSDERKYCRLKLSADGNTLDEFGPVIFHGFSTQVYGTFHRVGK
jgi:hypothetical protein